MVHTNTSVLMAGFGWIGAGIVSFATWFVLSRNPGSYASSPSNMLYLGFIVTLVGVAVLAFRKQINSLVEKKKRDIEAKKMQKQKQVPI
ncbi:MAG: hypothetical protein ACP5MZ_03380 [Candidatus Micrarchaeia archaeon]